MLKTVVLDLTGVYYTHAGLMKFGDWLVSKGLLSQEIEKIFFGSKPFQEAKVDYSKENEMWRFFYEAIEKLQALHPIELSADDHEQVMKQFAKHEERDEQLYELCQSLRVNKEITIGICSNTHLSHMQSRLMNHVEPVGVDFQILSFREGIAKPSPKMFERISEVAQSKPEEILFVDDNKGNVQAARKAGMQTLMYKNFETFQKDIKKAFPELLK